MSETFEEHYKNNHADYCHGLQREQSEKIWNHQQKKIDRALEQLYLEQNVMFKASMERKKLQATISEMSEVIKFYGDEWDTWLMPTGQIITSRDVEITEQNRPSGGKKARKLINKHPDIFKRGEV